MGETIGEMIAYLFGGLMIGIIVIVLGGICILLIRMITPSLKYIKKEWGPKPIDELCKRCGKLIDGRNNKVYCSEKENEECYRIRMVEERRKTQNVV